MVNNHGDRFRPPKDRVAQLPFQMAFQRLLNGGDHLEVLGAHPPSMALTLPKSL